ncbi:MAG: NupC/NupG family nucleoside CNT transporter [Deltaproteobacteria bacterium]|nr:NupC/NupG family nucleoside CNT transporter [Deltaproteobacteria bacterium]MBW2371835.1 NupC/NupG family nucleoside CNT transporter [Deltaproteobacteria bacterium]
MIGIAWAASTERRRFPLRTVVWGVALQFGLGLLLLRSPLGTRFFVGLNAGVAAFLGYTQAGVEFVFGGLTQTGFSFVVNVLPIIVFMGSVFAVLYHLGVVQRVVDALAWCLARTMGSSGAESLAAVANVFVGMTEAALVVKPFVPRMTRSELFTLMATGMATVAGSVLLAYVQILGGGDFAGHLVTASLLSAPAAILLAKVMVPETQTPATAETGHAVVPRESVNVIDAAARGAVDGMRLAATVGAMLVAFVAMVAMLNDATATLGGWFGNPELTLQQVLGFPFAPLVWLMGVPWSDAVSLGGVMGIKTVLNEFLAYQELRGLMDAGSVGARSAVIVSYAACGFANFGSLAILLGGVGAMAPSRRGDLASLGLRSILAGTLATMMTGCMAGLLLP